MGAFFSPDSKFMQAMSRLADLVILNLLFLVSCLPLFTIGAATTALYTVCFQIGTEKEGKILRTYFQAFRENFKQGTVLFLILALFILALLFDTLLLCSLTGWRRYGCVLTGFLLVLAVLMYSYAFPLLSQFSNGTRETLKNSLFLSLGYLPRSLPVAALNIFPLALALLNFYTFLYAGIMWVFLYFSAAAYLSSFLLKKVFARYCDPSADLADG